MRGRGWQTLGAAPPSPPKPLVVGFTFYKLPAGDPQGELDYFHNGTDLRVRLVFSEPVANAVATVAWWQNKS